MHAIFTTADHPLSMAQLRTEVLYNKQFQAVLMICYCQYNEGINSNSTSSSPSQEDFSTEGRPVTENLKWEHVKSFTMATTWVIQSLEVTRADVAPLRCADHRGQPQSPLPVIWCECETNQQLPHFLFLHSSSWHPESYSNTGKASSEQCCPKDTAKVPGHMQNLLLRRILPHWDSVGVCNNNLRTHCFLGETHQDGILDKQQNSQGSWTPAISYPWKMNGHSKATGNWTICVTVAGNEIFACPECWKASEGFTNRNGQRRQSCSACHTGDVIKVWVFSPYKMGAAGGDVTNAHSDGEGTPWLPYSVMPNLEPTLCCSPWSLQWQVPQQGSFSISCALRQCPERLQGASSPPSSC